MECQEGKVPQEITNIYMILIPKKNFSKLRGIINNYDTMSVFCEDI